MLLAVLPSLVVLSRWVVATTRERFGFPSTVKQPADREATGQPEGDPSQTPE